MNIKIFRSVRASACAFACRLFLLMVVLPAIPGQSLAALNSVAIEDAWNFRAVKEGTILRHEFVFKNNTAKPLRIVNIVTNSGCLACYVQKPLLAPGESSAVKIQLETKANLGAITIYVDLHTDNQSIPVIRYMVEAQIH